MGKGNSLCFQHKHSLSWPDIGYVENENRSMTGNRHEVDRKLRRFDSWTRFKRDYIGHHLDVKFGLDESRTVFIYRDNKLTIRNYVPKIIRQELTMGMWM